MLLKTRAPPSEPIHTEAPPMPNLVDVERAIRTEADRQGREVGQPSAAPPRPREVPMEARLHDIMQVCLFTNKCCLDIVFVPPCVECGFGKSFAWNEVTHSHIRLFSVHFYSIFERNVFISSGTIVSDVPGLLGMLVVQV